MQYLRLSFISIATGAIAAVLSGCGSTTTNMTQSGPAPAITGVGLQVNGVAPNRALYVQFNEAMNPATINSNTVVVKDSSGAAAPGNVVYDSKFLVAGFQPNPALHDNASYTLTVSTAAASAQGVPLPAAYAYSFTTRASTDASPIYVKSVTPAPNTTCVNPSAPITITFSEGADINTLNSTNIVITGPGNTVIPANIAYDVVTATVTLAPSAPLPSGAITVTVKNVADAAGEAMTSVYGWSFLTSCGAGGGGGTGTQFQATLFNEFQLNAIHGQITIDGSGNVTTRLTGATASATYTVQFCPAVDVASSYTNQPCFNVNTISTDTAGNATATAKFPQSGDWAGDFYIINSLGTADYQTWLGPNISNATYLAALLPDSQTNHGVVTTSAPQLPLTSGSISYANGSLVFTVKGASPNTAYFTNESETNYIDSSGTYALSNFTTDAMGNGSSTTVLSNTGGDLLQVGPQNFSSGAGYIGGFFVP